MMMIAQQGPPFFLLSQELEESFGQSKIRLAQRMRCLLRLSSLQVGVASSEAVSALALFMEEVHTDLLLLKKDIRTYVPSQDQEEAKKKSIKQAGSRQSQSTERRLRLR